MNFASFRLEKLRCSVSTGFHVHFSARYSRSVTFSNLHLVFKGDQKYILRGLYRALLRYGEDRLMLRRILLLENPKYLKYGLEALQYHRNVSESQKSYGKIRGIRLWKNMPFLAMLKLRILSFQIGLFYIRLRCQSTIAIINVFLISAFICLLVALFQLYRALGTLLQDNRYRHRTDVQRLITTVETMAKAKNAALLNTTE